MKRIIIPALLCFNCIIFSGCELLNGVIGKVGSNETFPQETAASIETVAAETVSETPAYVPSEADRAIAEWFTKDISDSEAFTDLLSYQYYARTLGLDKDYFLNPEVWEVYYNEPVVNINKDVDNTEIYLIRLNPYILLDIYASNNNTSVDELCKSLAITKEQLYYNWGYNPASVDYFKNHKDNKTTYSAAEQAVFGKHNGEERDIVMSTHMLTYDPNAKKEVSYSSSVSETLSIYRRDILGAFSDEAQMYSEFSDTEKNLAFRVNGIGIRAVIPLELPNALEIAKESEVGDADVSVIINCSPYTYGCIDTDKIDLLGVISTLNKK